MKINKLVKTVFGGFHRPQPKSVGKENEMVTRLNGKTLINIAGLVGASFLAPTLLAAEISPTEIAGSCNYGDCAIFHECTDYHDQENLREINEGRIVVKAVLAPIDTGCHGYLCATDADNEVRKTLKCERSAKLARLVLAARDL